MIIYPPVLCVLVLPVVVEIIGCGKLVAGEGLSGYAPAATRSQSAHRDEQDSVPVGCDKVTMVTMVTASLIQGKFRQERGRGFKSPAPLLFGHSYPSRIRLVLF